MALQKIKHSILFNQGLDTKTNPKITTGFLQLENCELTNVSVQKTPGLREISSVPNLSIVPYTKNVFETNNQLEIAANNQVYEYDPLSGTLFPRGSFEYLERTESILVSASPTSLFYSEYGNFGVFCYETNGTFYIRIQNLVAGIVINTVNITQYLNVPMTEYPVGCLATNVGIFLYGQETPGGFINEYYFPYDQIRPFSTSLHIITTAQNVVPTAAADDNAYPPFVQKTKTLSIEFPNGFIWIFYVDVTGNPTVLIRNLSGFTVTSILNVVMGVPIYTRALTGDNFAPANLCSTFYFAAPLSVGGISYSSVVFCIFNNTICVFNPDTLSFVVNFTQPTPANPNYVQSMCVLQSNGWLVLLKEDLREYDTDVSRTAPNTTYPYTIYNELDVAFTWGRTDNTKTQPFNYTFSDFEFGQGFVTGSLWATYDNVYFCVMAIPYVTPGGTVGERPSSNPQNRHGNYYIIDWNYNLVDFVLHYLGSKNTIYFDPDIPYTRTAPLAVIESKPNQVTNEIGYTFMEDVQSVISGGEVTFDNQAVVFDVGLPGLTKLVSYDRGLTGYYGITNMYVATQSNVEYSGFLDFPNIVAYPEVPDTNMFWTYAVTFEYVNQNGELMRSAPSIFFSIETDTMTGIIIAYTYPSTLETKVGINIRLWRTTINTQTFYLVAQMTYVPGTTPYFFTDGTPPLADDVLVTNELAYFSGGILGEIPFDPFYTFTSHQNTLFAVNLENRNRIEYSLPQQRTVAMATAFGLDFDVEAQGGPIIEIASLDTILVIFKENFIYAVEGQGADATGNNSSLTIPTIITSPVGCTEKSSVIRIPQIPNVTDGGIMFKSNEGIYLLDRSLRVSYIGAPVEAFNDLTITNATLNQTENKVRYTTQEGTILTFDYYYNTWSTEVGINLVSTAVYQNNFVGIDANAVLFQIFEGYYKDNKPYSMQIGTPWIKLAGLQGYQRVYQVFVLGDFINTNVISIGIMYDFVDVVVDWLYFRKNVTNTYGANFPEDAPAWGASTPNPGWGDSNAYGTFELSNYEIQFNMPRQKCQAIRFIIRDEFDNIITDTGNSFTLTEIAIWAGIKSEAPKLPVSRRV